jgi:hypothetical protein
MTMRVRSNSNRIELAAQPVTNSSDIMVIATVSVTIRYAQQQVGVPDGELPSSMPHGDACAVARNIAARAWHPHVCHLRKERWRLSVFSFLFFFTYSGLPPMERAGVYQMLWFFLFTFCFPSRHRPTRTGRS